MSQLRGTSVGRARGGGPRGGGERGRADMHLHSLYSDGTVPVHAILDHVQRETDLDVIAITDHERIDGALRAAEIHADGDYAFDLVIGEEITTRRGHVLALFVTERLPALRPLDETLAAIHAQGGIAIAAHPMAPVPLSVGRRSLREIRHHEREGVHFDALELFNPSHAGRMRQKARLELNAAELRLPGVGNSDAHTLEHIGTGYTTFPGHTAEDYRQAVLTGTAEPGGDHWSTAHNVGVYRRQLHAKLKHLYQTIRPGHRDWR